MLSYIFCSASLNPSMFDRLSCSPGEEAMADIPVWHTLGICARILSVPMDSWGSHSGQEGPLRQMLILLQYSWCLQACFHVIAGEGFRRERKAASLTCVSPQALLGSGSGDGHTGGTYHPLHGVHHSGSIVLDSTIFEKTQSSPVRLSAFFLIWAGRTRPGFCCAEH